MRFALPREVLAFRGIADLLVRRVLPAGWIPDLRPDATVADAVRIILSEVGLTMDEAFLHLWVEMEADILVRTGPNPDRGEHRRRCRKCSGGRSRKCWRTCRFRGTSKRGAPGRAVARDRWLNEELDIARRDIDAQRAEAEELRARSR